MFWTIVGILIVLVFTIWAFYESGFPELFAGMFLGLLIGALVFPLGNLIVGGILSSDPNNLTFEKTSSVELVALKDNNEVSGAFFLGSGTINNTSCYYYVAQQELGMHMYKVPTDQSYLQYVNDNYRIESYEAKFAKDWMNEFGFVTAKPYYIIYIPSGSITTEFSIDLE